MAKSPQPSPPNAAALPLWPILTKPKSLRQTSPKLKLTISTASSLNCAIAAFLTTFLPSKAPFFIPRSFGSRWSALQNSLTTCSVLRLTGTASSLTTLAKPPTTTSLLRSFTSLSRLSQLFMPAVISKPGLAIAPPYLTPITARKSAPPYGCFWPAD